MPSVLVTGCNGYIGSQTVKTLAEAGWTVTGIDLTNDPRSGILPYLSYYNDARTVPTSHVVHTAATSLVGPSIKNPADYWKNNVAGMTALLEGLLEGGLERVVFSSSAAVYGDGHSVYSEMIQPRPISPYGRTKLAGEWMLEDYARAYGITAVALRYFNVCGADLDGKLGQRADATHIIPSMFRHAAAGMPAVINGKTHNTPDGTAERDYVHVVDVARANMLALTAPIETFSAINIGSNVGYSNLGIVEAINKYTPLKLAVEFGPAREGDPATLISNNKRAIATLGWKPEYSDLETIIKTAYNWHKN